jgi:hypothetical protein
VALVIPGDSRAVVVKIKGGVNHALFSASAKQSSQRAS